MGSGYVSKRERNKSKYFVVIVVHACSGGGLFQLGLFRLWAAFGGGSVAGWRGVDAVVGRCM